VLRNAAFAAKIQIVLEVPMRITSKGQVTIPLAVRNATGLLPNCEVEFEIKGKNAVLVKATRRPLRGEAIVRRLRGRGSVRMSTDEIMALTRGE
jgi:antitoxin PrlF